MNARRAVPRARAVQLGAAALPGLAALVAVAGAVALAPQSAPWKLVLVATLWTVPGVLIAAARPRSLVGWSLLSAAVLFAVSGACTVWLETGHTAGAAWAAWVVDRSSALIVPATTLVLLLLPDGRLPSRTWRPFAAGVIGAQVVLVAAWALLAGPAAAPDSTMPGWTRELANPVGMLPSAWAHAVSLLEPWLLTAPLLLVAVAVVHRFVRGRGDERRRMTDVLVAALVFALCVVVGRWVWPAVSDVFDVTGAAVLALVLTSAVLRRRMPQVSRLVGHLAVYSTLWVVGAFATVAVLALLRRAGTETPQLAVGLVASAVVLLLLPLRHLLRRMLDRARHGPGPTADEQVGELTAQLTRSRQELISAREEERAAIRRELHDVLGPTLAGLTMQLGTLPALVRSHPEAVADRLVHLEEAARGSLEDVRRLSRDLRPPALDELGLLGALADLAERQGLSLVSHGAHDEPVAPAVEVAAYRIASEAITNAARHSGATRVDLTLDRRDGHLRMQVADPGCGVRGTPAGVGTLSMRERAAELGGRLTIRDTDGGGTTVEATLPLARAVP